MVKLKNFLILSLFALYLLILQVTGGVQYYLSERYYGLFTFSALAFGIFSIGGLINTVLTLKKRMVLKSEITKLWKNDFKIFLILLTPIIGLWNGLIFLLITITILLPWANVKNDTLFKSKNLVIDVTLFIILAAALVFPPQSLSAQTVVQRYDTINSVIGQGSSDISLIQSFAGDTSTYTIRDWISVLNSGKNIYEFEKKTASVIGFVILPKVVGNENIAMVARFAISCCVIDATPVGLFFQVPQGIILEENQWISVTGQLEVQKINGVNSLVIIPQQLNNASQPERPYI